MYKLKQKGNLGKKQSFFFLSLLVCFVIGIYKRKCVNSNEYFVNLEGNLHNDFLYPPFLRRLKSKICVHFENALDLDARNLSNNQAKDKADRELLLPNYNSECKENCLLERQVFKTKKDIIGTYAEETSVFICNIKCNIPFSYSRWNDGELDTLTGWRSKTRIKMTSLEGWTTEKNTLNSNMFNAALLQSLEIRNPNFLYGFNFPSCGEGLMIQQLSGGGSWKWVSRFSRLNNFPPLIQLTYSDLLSGRNYHYFGMKKLISQIANQKNVVVFANKRVQRNKNIPWLERIVPFDADLTGNWLQNGESIVRDAKVLAKAKTSHIFLLALGPISNILVSVMWKENPYNTYIDVGSALNEFHGFGSQGRAYMRNPACQAIGPTCTSIRYKPNLQVGSSSDFRIRSAKEIDKLRCCTPILTNCSLELKGWYPPVGGVENKKRTCQGIVSKELISKHIVKLCRCGDMESAEKIIKCVDPK